MKILLLLFLLSIGALAAAPKADLNARDPQGAKVHLKDLRGKLIVLNFWATWCTPCREEMPMLVGYAQNHRSPDLLFIAVSVDDEKTQPRVPGAAKQFGIDFPVWIGATGDDLYKLSKGEAVPATIFIDRDGAIVARVSGQIREDELKERVDWLTGNRSGPHPEEFVSHVQ